MATTVRDGEVVENPESIEKVVRIENIKVENFNTEDAKIIFSIDKNINLKLTSKDNIVISAIDKHI